MSCFGFSLYLIEGSCFGKVPAVQFACPYSAALLKPISERGMSSEIVGVRDSSVGLRYLYALEMSPLDVESADASGSMATFSRKQ